MSSHSHRRDSNWWDKLENSTWRNESTTVTCSAPELGTDRPITRKISRVMAIFPSTNFLMPTRTARGQKTLSGSPKRIQRQLLGLWAQHTHLKRTRNPRGMSTR
mmetsp:Transcript_55183/g.134099  ORF Transcript_55183/g.134099 Transcript_55183/m.134099 type:complete len:104 (+) Transcript_55183:946-1257(+)